MNATDETGDVWNLYENGGGKVTFLMLFFAGDQYARNLQMLKYFMNTISVCMVIRLTLLQIYLIGGQHHVQK